MALQKSQKKARYHASIIAMTIYDEIKQPKVVYKCSSKYNKDIKVVDTGKILKLVVDGHVQSVSRGSLSAENRVWGQAAQLIKHQIGNPTSILILGLGGGTMQHIFSREFPEANLISVEIDELMVDVAKQYFHVDEIPNHKILIEDACRVVVEPEEFDLKAHTFDACIVDIFIGDAFPDLGSSGNFLAHVKKMVKTGGLVVFNRIYLDEHQEDVDIFIETVEDFFLDVDTAVIAGKTNADHILIYGQVS